MILRPRLIAPVVAALAIAALTVVACGGNGNEATPARPAATNTSAPAAAGSPAGGIGNNVTMLDFSYNPQRFNARVGQQVQLTVTNGGQQPHTFTITGVVDTGTMTPGQTRVVTFTPAQPGNLTFFCTIHGQNAMSGQVIVAGTAGSLPASGDAFSISWPASAAASALA